MVPNTGNVCSNQNANVDKYPVIMAMPMIIIMMPDVICNGCPRRRKVFIRRKKYAVNVAAMRNGTAMPSEYTANKETPPPIVVDAALKVSTAPNTGPIQGVQPKPNARPRI